MAIHRVGVVGAGVMGSAIAAHLAGAGIQTLLLDIVPRDLPPEKKADPKLRSRLAEEGKAKALASKPALFFHPRAAELVETGNLEDHASRLSDCDLVIEAVVESAAIKRAVYDAITPHLGANTILATNTSGLSLRGLSEALPATIRPRFVAMHFFNPVRYMNLVEVVAGPETRPDVVESVAAFGRYVGKGIVYGKDTTNFVANRIGVFAILYTMHAMLEDGVSIEEVDAIFGAPLGRPKSATFGTADLVGLDTLLHVAKNCYDSLPGDESREIFKTPAFVEALAQKGALGKKSGAGFFKKEGKALLVLDPASGSYVEQKSPRFDSLGAARKAPNVGAGIKAVVESTDRAGAFAWKVLARTLRYAANRIPEIADDVVNVDRAMRWGFNWELGPFETWDAIGVRSSVERMQAEGIAVPGWVLEMLAAGRERFYDAPLARDYWDPGTKAARPLPRDARDLSVAWVKTNPKTVVKENAGASLVDLGDGVLGIEVHTKMNTVDTDVIALMQEAPSVAEQGFRAIVLGNDGQHFGAGANLMMIVGAALQQKWGDVDAIIASLQSSLQGLRYARVPVVSAPCRYTLGGGAEVAMAADAAVAYAETYMGLVEVGVGLLPAGGGCLRMVERYTAPLVGIDGADSLAPIAQASLQIAMAKASASADEAKDLRYLLPTDGICLNRDELLAQAKARAIGMAESGYRPPRPPLLRAAGYDAAKTIETKIWGMVEGGFATPHDALIAKKIAHVLCGGVVPAGTELTEQRYLDLEREAFLSLCGEPKTHARIEHMLKTGQPLRN